MSSLCLWTSVVKFWLGSVLLALAKTDRKWQMHLTLEILLALILSLFLAVGLPLQTLHYCFLHCPHLYLFHCVLKIRKKKWKGVFGLNTAWIYSAYCWLPVSVCRWKSGCSSRISPILRQIRRSICIRLSCSFSLMAEMSPISSEGVEEALPIRSISCFICGLKKLHTSSTIAHDSEGSIHKMKVIFMMIVPEFAFDYFYLHQRQKKCEDDCLWRIHRLRGQRRKEETKKGFGKRDVKGPRVTSSVIHLQCHLFPSTPANKMNQKGLHIHSKWTVSIESKET